MVQLKQPKAIVCDIEGTTTSLRFWSDVLAPFINENVGECLRDGWNNGETVDVITMLRNKSIDDVLAGENVPLIAEESASSQGRPKLRPSLRTVINLCSCSPRNHR